MIYNKLNKSNKAPNKWRIWKMTRTALVRNNATKNLKIFRSNEYKTQSEFAQDLRGNGFRVLKIWNENKSDSEVDNWELLNRK